MEINEENVMRLYVNGTDAKLYVNDVLYTSVILEKGGLIYSKLLLMNIPPETSIYEIKGRNLQAVKDCAGIVNGSAYFDNCGNCVGGTTSVLPCSVVSESDLLELYSLNNGDILDKNLIVGIDEDTQRKWISGVTQTKGSLIKQVTISEEFELVVRAVSKTSDDVSINLISGEDKIILYFDSDEACLNNLCESTSWRQNEENVMRLYVNKTDAKLYVNDVLCKKVILEKGGLLYTSLELIDVNPETLIYEIKTRNLQPAKDCAGVVGGYAYFDDCGNCVGGTTGKSPCVIETIWDLDNDKKWSLPDIIYGLQVLSGAR